MAFEEMEDEVIEDCQNCGSELSDEAIAADRVLCFDCYCDQQD